MSRTKYHNVSSFGLVDRFPCLPQNSSLHQFFTAASLSIVSLNLRKPVDCSITMKVNSLSIIDIDIFF